MKKGAIIINLFFTIQALENSQTQIVFDYVKYIILLICFMAASILMMLIPVVLAYSMVDNFISMKKFKEILKKKKNSKNLNSKYIKTICGEYHKASSKFFKNLSALLTWNIFSFIYIFFGYENFSDGLKEYFYFPFAVLQSLNKDEIFDSLYKFQSNWLFMAAIVFITFSFSFFGKYLGKDIAENRIEKMKLF